MGRTGHYKQFKGKTGGPKEYHKRCVIGVVEVIYSYKNPDPNCSWSCVASARMSSLREGNVSSRVCLVSGVGGLVPLQHGIGPPLLGLFRLRDPLPNRRLVQT